LDSFYCIWDSFRAQHPLLTIIDPEVQTDMVRALIDIYRHEGWWQIPNPHIPSGRLTAPRYSARLPDEFLQGLLPRRFQRRRRVSRCLHKTPKRGYRLGHCLRGSHHRCRRYDITRPPSKPTRHLANTPSDPFCPQSNHPTGASAAAAASSAGTNWATSPKTTKTSTAQAP
jgi:hypothetical protein